VSRATSQASLVTSTSWSGVRRSSSAQHYDERIHVWEIANEMHERVSLMIVA